MEIEKFNLQEMAYPEAFDFKVLLSIRSFKGRLEYVVSHLEKIASGSSRVAYRVDDEKVLKIAKNEKGLAQNNQESTKYFQEEHGSIVARVYNVDKSGIFLEMELARKCKESDFIKYWGVSFKDVVAVLQTTFNTSRYTSWPKPSSDDIYDNEYVYELTNMIGDYDLPIGDFTRLSTYGIVKRGGEEHLVIIDNGLSKEIYNKYYSPKRNRHGRNW